MPLPPCESCKETRLREFTLGDGSKSTKCGSCLEAEYQQHHRRECDSCGGPTRGYVSSSVVKNMCSTCAMSDGKSQQPITRVTNSARHNPLQTSVPSGHLGRNNHPDHLRSVWYVKYLMVPKCGMRRWTMGNITKPLRAVLNLAMMRVMTPG
uniref:Stc1 domain-containing protein n=1 Tax=Kwoniella pini CBS 10737 TaxID=1296096 RepID=A0A1B9I3D2_9TREE|nr:uncharacterized protein I206_03359 [Kwoniella pini CBS 10737]OCF50043.1 hypothetical protein I206_03359 [Kwoniella pini CBS 10737]